MSSNDYSVNTISASTLVSRARVKLDFWHDQMRVQEAAVNAYYARPKFGFFNNRPAKEHERGIMSGHFNRSGDYNLFLIQERIQLLADFAHRMQSIVNAEGPDTPVSIGSRFIKYLYGDN